MNWIKTIQTALTIGILMTTVAAEAQLCSLKIYGQVISKDSGKPIPFANVFQEVTLKGAVTDENGEFEIDGLCPGHIHLIVSHVNYERQLFQFDIESDTVISLEMETNVKLLSTITVIGQKDVEDAGYAKSSLSRTTLDQMSGKSLGESLEAVTGITSLKSGPGISKPMIHGLYGNRIRIINNEIRQEGQQWGNEHAPEIDPFSANKITVVKGASAVKYGTEAISGAILVEPAPLPEDHHLHGEVNLVGMSNGRMGVAAAKLEGGFGKSGILRWRAQGTYKFAGDFNTPDYFLTNTGIRENNFLVALGTNTEKLTTEIYYSYFNTTLGILRGSHIGNLTDLDQAISREEPFFTNPDFSNDINVPRQEVIHHTLKAKSEYVLNDNNVLTGVYGFQFNDRKEFDVRRGGRSERPALDMDLPSHSLDLGWLHEISPNINTELGLRYTYQVNKNSSETGVRPLIPDYTTYRPGIYWIGNYVTKKWQAEIGIGYDYQYLGVRKFNELNELVRPEHNFNNLSISAGGVVKLNKNLRYSVNFGLASRAPNVNELYSEGLHHGAAAIEEGDPNLNIEQSFKNIHTFTLVNSDLYSLEVSGYYHHVNDYIFLKPQPEPRLTIRGAFPVYQYVQSDVNIWGLDLGGRVQVINGLFWETKASTIHAYDLTENEPLIFMPADRWKNSLSYRFKTTGKIEDFEVSISGLQVWEQKRVPMNEVDPEAVFDSQIEYNYAIYEDYAPPPPGYFIMDIEGGLSVQQADNRIKIHLAVRNIFDVAFRDYLNRLRYFADDLGRNIELRLKYIF